MLRPGLIAVPSYNLRHGARHRIRGQRSSSVVCATLQVSSVSCLCRLGNRVDRLSPGWSVDAGCLVPGAHDPQALEVLVDEVSDAVPPSPREA